MSMKNEQGGELVVLGHDRVEITLKEYPRRVDVFFKKKNSPPPCDPHHHAHLLDPLEWEVKRCRTVFGKTKWVLDIEWGVHEIREIVWLVYY